LLDAREIASFDTHRQMPTSGEVPYQSAARAPDIQMSDRARVQFLASAHEPGVTCVVIARTARHQVIGAICRERMLRHETPRHPADLIAMNQALQNVSSLVFGSDDVAIHPGDEGIDDVRKISKTVLDAVEALVDPVQ
jgi:hypothetical protein